MSLSNSISVNSNYTRSINLERDADSLAVIESYIPTSRAISTLHKIQNTFSSQDMPRAWGLIGPYGSGKSSFAIFLSHLFANQELLSSQTALKVIAKSDNKLLKAFTKYNKGLGHCNVLITGSPEPLSQKLVATLVKAAEDYWPKNKNHPKSIKVLKTLSKKKNISISDVIDSIKALQASIEKIEGKGIIIIVDELGKFLEYEARHPETNDIYLLQTLAELAYVNHEAQLSLIVLQHQSFEQYAKGLSETAKNEWIKIQGRFETIPFLESSEQTLKVVSSAIEHNKSLDYNKITPKLKKIVKSLYETKALPSTLAQKDAENLFKECYPLHPISALLLPLLCQKIAQNERTLFNYLGSSEKHGFNDSLQQLNKIGDWIYPWEIYEYFIQNQSAVLLDHFTHRRWTEVVTAVERIGDADENTVFLLKTIGLFNIIGSHIGFKASTNLIHTCLPTIKQSEEACKTLINKSVIQFRKYSGEYRVWEGSDLDIDAEIVRERGKLGQFSIAEYLNKSNSIQPVIARRTSIETGTIRIFKPIFIDRISFTSIPKQDSKPRIIFYLCEDKQDEKDFDNKIISNFSELDVVVKFLQVEHFRTAISELKAINAIKQNSLELQSDPIAQRELKDRLRIASKLEENLISEFLDKPENSKWYWKKKALMINHKRDLQISLSTVLDSVYRHAPTIKNELINRDIPSTQAAAARNKLLEAMTFSSEKENLGFEKFPAEKPIYQAVLKETRIHIFSKEESKWVFSKPNEDSSIHNAWIEIDKFLDSTETTSRSFQELEGILTLPPYGIKRGILPILYLAIYLVYQDETALYEDGHYIPSLSKEILERFVKTPHLFKVQLFRMKGIRSTIFKQYITALFEDDRKRTVIQAIRPLTKIIGNLNLYTQKTSDLSSTTLLFRNSFFHAKSPEQLLFIDMPKALGFDPNNFSGTDKDNYVEVLKKTISELTHAYSKMLELQQSLLAQSLKLDSGSSISEIRHATGKYIGLDSYTVDTDGLKAFLNRLLDKELSNEKWLLNILMFLGRKSPDKWLDSDKAKVEARLTEYSHRLLDLQVLKLQNDRTKEVNNDDFEVILVKTIKQGSGERSQAVVINASQREIIDTMKKGLLKDFKNAPEELKLAILAELTNESLKKYQSTTKANNKSKARVRKSTSG